MMIYVTSRDLIKLCIIVKDLSFNTVFIILTVIPSFFLDSTNFCPINYFDL